ncbi:MAG: hypothetical protein EXQ85_04635 [Alphaproteobacteria bacterium]|nr:hypothetical protein [Alphaproteobacteria bacterium]
MGPRRSRTFYLAAMRRYFDRMDRGDVAVTVACFAPRGELICETAAMRLKGRWALTKFFQAITDNTRGMTHRMTNAVIDTASGTGAAELIYRNSRKIGAALDMENCNFFDFDGRGRFKRVRFWTGRLVNQSVAMDAAKREMKNQAHRTKRAAGR